ncbi:hypothetical protein B0H17DRAFT_952932 [Mycena rosella]|uniref:Uncharacterized protein n=1 Tax=Mycena rosella TaxID=1033263 RepID=A0AAD7CTK9_MYCRO|nr:hypothetical protein B0H17DRAFT_952932 [Mycena rosella]
MCALAQVQVCIAAVSNRTIDDVNGDSITGLLPAYDSNCRNPWHTDGNCSACFMKPDPSQVFDRTWHDTRQKNERESPACHHTAYGYVRTAINFFYIVPNTVPHSFTAVSLTFTIDSTSHGSYGHVPDASSDTLYVVLVLAAEGVTNEPHTLVARTVQPSLFIFDYAMYT